MMVIMALVTTIATTPLLRRIVPAPAAVDYGVRVTRRLSHAECRRQLEELDVEGIMRRQGALT